MDIYDFFDQLEADFGYVPKVCVETYTNVYDIPEAELKKMIERDFNHLLEAASVIRESKNYAEEKSAIKEVLENVQAF
jgi:hypothetical protein